MIQLAYAIGVSKPLSIFIQLGEGDGSKIEKIKKIINDNFNLSPRGIREMLKLNKPIYEITPHTDTLVENQQIRENFREKKINRIYLNCNLEKP